MKNKTISEYFRDDDELWAAVVLLKSLTTEQISVLEVEFVEKRGMPKSWFKNLIKMALKSVDK